MLASCLKSLVAILGSIILWPILFLILALNEATRVFVSILLRGSGSTLVSDGYENIFHCKQTLTGSLVLVALFSPDEANLKDDLVKWENVFKKREPDGSQTYAKLTKIFSSSHGYGTLKVDDGFNVKNHVRIFNPSLGQEHDFWTEDQVVKEVLPLLFGEMDGSKPQWEWVLLPRVRRKDDGATNSLRIFRFHHGYMDGVSAGLLLTENIFDWMTETGQPPKIPYIIHPKSPDLPKYYYFKLYGIYAWALAISPMLLFGSAVSLILSSIRKPKLGPLAVQKAYSGSNIFGISDKIPLQWINSIKAGAKLAGTPVSTPSVLSTAMQQPFANLLHRRGIKVDASDGVKLSLALNQALPPFKDSRPRNQFTALVTNLDLKRDSNLSWVNTNFGLSLCVPIVYLKTIGRFPLPLLRPLFGLGGVEASLSNIPFTKRTGKICGTEISEVLVFSMIPIPQGIGQASIGYGDFTRLTFYTVPECMSRAEMETFLQDYVLEVKSMAGKVAGNEGLDV